MSISKYEVFLKVVELGSLTRAAEVLGFTQSGISHTISSLESEFGFTLLLRNRSGVRLTVNGEQVVQPIREIMKWNEQLKQQVADIHGLETGTITIGTFTSVSVHWLPGMIKQFRQEYPYIGFKLMEGGYLEIEQWIEAGVVDCGFISLPTRENFEVFPLKQDRMLAILSKEHPLSKAPYMPLAQIAHEDFIIPKAGSDYDVRRVLEKAAIKPNIKFSAGDDYAIIAMVENGLGISILPELVIQRQNHNVAMLELEERSFRSLGIAVHSMRHASPATRRFLGHVQSWFK
ncbi:LysR family transcriptional regulator [Paenibacillus jilunlii]|uniref:DNA-binding transcriptional regulator, LysR family n=1 Tax=Paenibacillus jilunlii TaxID=682956 RepID=A0A1G9HIT8_9BACL|nr:LysR family transcriptional regulator [Paenibacillus jilunlii]KWX69679.1 LysR family transcriptional regulator [Paenibacillus jilunlii]SDL12433.1 DNA-binding transcriptional regulator, LysR family [Paenibacillus jilunlii]